MLEDPQRRVGLGALRRRGVGDGPVLWTGTAPDRRSRPGGEGRSVDRGWRGGSRHRQSFDEGRFPRRCRLHSRLVLTTMSCTDSYVRRCSGASFPVRWATSRWTKRLVPALGSSGDSIPSRTEPNGAGRLQASFGTLPRPRAWTRGSLHDASVTKPCRSSNFLPWS